MERRATQRRRVLKGGSIEFDGRTVECVLRNISATGAALQVDRRLCIPHEFKLNISHGEVRQTCQNCRVVWRKEALIGLAFEPAA
jgi:PilZ domain-containing protein